VTTATVAKSGRLLVRGTIARAATGRVSVTYRATIAGRSRSKTAQVRIRRGRYAAAIDLPRGWRSARHARVTVRYAGSNSARAMSRTLVVRI
jgi:hypothetical protein